MLRDTLVRPSHHDVRAFFFGGLLGNPWKLAFVTLLILPWGPLAVGADPEPPKPNPAQPVNYVEWMNKTFGGSVQNNAYKEYLAVYAEIKPFDGNLDRVTQGPWSGNKPIADWLASNTGALEKFRTAAAKRCYFPLERPASTGDARRDGLVMHVVLPPLDKHRLVCKALIAEGYAAWNKGDEALLLKNASAILRAGHHLESEATLIQRLVGQATGGSAYSALRNAMKLSNDPGKLAANVLRGLAEADPSRTPVNRVLLGERISSWDMCQRVFVPAEAAGTWTIYDPNWTELGKGMPDGAWDAAAKQAVQGIGFDATLQEINAYYDALDRWYEVPYAKSADETAKLERAIKNSKNPLAKNILPLMARARAIDEFHTVSGNATRLIAHLWMHQSKTGDFPSTLDGLKIAELAQLRIDPFSGRDLVYKPDGDGFTLYSVHDNLKDDGGRHSSKPGEADFVFWPVQP